MQQRQSVPAHPPTYSSTIALFLCKNKKRNDLKEIKKAQNIPRTDIFLKTLQVCKTPGFDKIISWYLTIRYGNYHGTMGNVHEKSSRNFPFIISQRPPPSPVVSFKRTYELQLRDSKNRFNLLPPNRHILLPPNRRTSVLSGRIHHAVIASEKMSQFLHHIRYGPQPTILAVLGVILTLVHGFVTVFSSIGFINHSVILKTGSIPRRCWAAL